MDDYHSQLKDLAKKLDRIVNVHVAHRLEDNHNEVMEVLTHRLEDNHIEIMEAFGKIGERSTSSQPSSTVLFQSIIPPPPADIFTGREDYLKLMKDSFKKPKTSVEMAIQRIFVLYGIGGIGKTQLALKFLDENRERCVIVPIHLDMTLTAI